MNVASIIYHHYELAASSLRAKRCNLIISESPESGKIHDLLIGAGENIVASDDKIFEITDVKR